MVGMTMLAADLMCTLMQVRLCFFFVGDPSHTYLMCIFSFVYASQKVGNGFVLRESLFRCPALDCVTPWASSFSELRLARLMAAGFVNLTCPLAWIRRQ